MNEEGSFEMLVHTYKTLLRQSCMTVIFFGFHFYQKLENTQFLRSDEVQFRPRVKINTATTAASTAIAALIYYLTFNF
jgi:hypothetical protein